MQDEQAKLFSNLFKGKEDVIGTFEATGTDGQKTIGNAQMFQREPLISDYFEHLFGNTSLGIVPIRTDNTCLFAAIDYDVYGEDLEEIVTSAGDFPLVPCKTKSSGLHLYVFFKEPVPAIYAIDLMKSYAAKLGISRTVNRKGAMVDVEIFPKQKMVTEWTMGSFINLPYHNGTRVAVSKDLKELSLEEFLDLAESKKISLKEVKEATQPSSRELDSSHELYGCASCLPTMLKSNGGRIPLGGRNNGLLAFAIYFSKRYADHFDKENVVLEQTLAINKAFCEPPLPDDEVTAIVRSQIVHNYQYKCGDIPISSYCNKSLCIKQKFGILHGQESEELEFEDLTHIIGEPPMLRWTINGREVEFEYTDIVEGSRKKIAHRIFEEAHILLPEKYTFKELNKLFMEHWDSRKSIKIGLEGTSKGLMYSHLADFISQHLKEYKGTEELINYVRAGKVIKRQKTYCFKLESLLSFFDAKHFKDYNKTKVVSMLRKDFDGSHMAISHQGMSIRVWKIAVDKVEKTVGEIEEI